MSRYSLDEPITLSTLEDIGLVSGLQIENALRESGLLLSVRRQVINRLRNEVHESKALEMTIPELLERGITKGNIQVSDGQTSGTLSNVLKISNAWKVGAGHDFVLIIDDEAHVFRHFVKVRVWPKEKPKQAEEEEEPITTTALDLLNFKPRWDGSPRYIEIAGYKGILTDATTQNLPPALVSLVIDGKIVYVARDLQVRIFRNPPKN